MGAKLSCVAGPLLVMMALVEFRSAHVVGRIPNSSAYAEIVVCICAIVEAASLWRVRSTCLMYFGTAIVLSIPTMATVAKAKLADNEQAFYRMKIDTARFYFSKLLPRSQSHRLQIENGSETLMSISIEDFKEAIR